MKKAKEFIVGSTVAFLLSSSALTATAAAQPAPWHQQAIEAATQTGTPVRLHQRKHKPALLIPEENRYQKKMYYKQLVREKKERQINS